MQIKEEVKLSKMSSMNGYMDHILLQEKLECLEYLTTSNNPHKRLELNVCHKLAWHYLGLYLRKPREFNET